MTKSLLMIPLNLNALCLAQGKTVVEPMAHFNRLPYFDGTRDLNRNFGNISELIVSTPFQNCNLYLPAGLHLHWQLPQTLSKGFYNEQGVLEFPTVPNRWLIIRKRQQDHSQEWIIEKTWIVESDYLWPISQKSGVAEIEYDLYLFAIAKLLSDQYFRLLNFYFQTLIEQRQEPQSVTIPFLSEETVNNSENLKVNNQPFRYLGRQLTLKKWLRQSGGNYWGKSLTAVGYGEATFAAFYPNCYSVFGAYDPEITEINPHLSYDILGWYSDPQFDYLTQYLQQLKLENSNTNLIEQLLSNFQENLQWNLNQTELEKIPIPDEIKDFDLKICCYGRLKFEGKTTPQTNKLDLTKIALANSGTEALSAYLATELARDSVLSKRTLENILEALQLATNLENEQVDLEIKLQDARHEKSFSATSNDWLWTIEKITAKTTNNEETNQLNSLHLPENIAGLLLETNQLQKQYNQSHHELESRQKQLFSDWYKYVLCSYPPIGRITEYPDPNLVRLFLLNQGVNPLINQRELTGNLLLGKNEQGEIITARSEGENAQSLAQQLANKINELLREISSFNDSEAAKKLKLSYQLKPIPSPRYWQPNEPVVMIVGEITKAITPYQNTNSSYLNCSLVSDINPDLLALFNHSSVANIERPINYLIEKIDELLSKNNQGLAIYNQEPWQPLILEWEVGMMPIQNEIGSRFYPSNLILQNYQFAEKTVELETNSLMLRNKEVINTYNGRNILSPYAALQQTEKLLEYFQKQPIFEQYCQEKNLNIKNIEWLTQNDLVTWINAQINLNQQQKNIYLALINAYQKLQETSSLSQCLGGFNQALLGKKQTLQLNIDDPIGFIDYQPFVESVASAIAQNLTSAPQPLNFYNPIRLGTLQIQRLRLIDTFGQIQDIPLSGTLITPEYLKPRSSNTPNQVILPPRLVQSAKMSFRWLSANPNYEGESASHPSLNPICGWLVSDRFDQTLEIYNTEGKSLGELEITKVGESRWRSSPGSSHSVNNIADIPNPYLRKVVEYLDQSTDQFLEVWLLALAKAWEQIEPNNFATSPSLALLMGQPLAIVRASINLELQGLPAVNQDWDVFRQDLRRTTRENNGFPSVNFPFYLGDYRRKTDGLVGYWLEDQAGNLSDSVYIPQAQLTETAQLREETHQIITRRQLLSQSIISNSQIVTMLIDPRAEINLISGILPSKTIKLLPEHYIEPLNAIETTFLVAPILTPSPIYLPTLEEQGYSWSWLEKDQAENWLEITTLGQIKEQQFKTLIQEKLEDFKDNEKVDQLWLYLLQEEIQWLKNNDKNPDLKIIVPSNQRKKQMLDPPYQNQEKQIDYLLDLCAIKIRPVDLEANFSPQQIREGWLKLRKI